MAMSRKGKNLYQFQATLQNLIIRQRKGFEIFGIEIFNYNKYSVASRLVQKGLVR